jgi:hypothetical protein
MSKNQERNDEIGRWLQLRKADGLIVDDSKRKPWFVNGKKTQIKNVQTRRRDGTFWSSISSKQLKENEVFVWLIQKAESYYAFPQEKMKEYAKTGWFSQKYDLFSFLLDDMTHEYIAHKRYNIRDYYQNSLTSHSPFI